VKSLRSSTAIRQPARTLLRAIPAEATVLPPALAGSPSVGGARQVTMPPAPRRLPCLVSRASCYSLRWRSAWAHPPPPPSQ